MKRKKILVAMSGGVDSSVTAAILKKNGYDVVGVFMKFWQEPGEGRENLCCSAKARLDAKRVAIKLGIPFYVLDVRKEFKKRVVDYFLKECKKGNTPNPCVECNRHIKFKFLIDTAIKLKADYVATGHYAKAKNGKLMVAKDKKKDQSYFLWQLTQKQLSKIIFPLGNFIKEQVRGLAKKFGLSVAEKKDSQEICFINANISEFLKKRIKTNNGPIITKDGKKIGEHKGLIFYTIGQRKGIEIGGAGPYYVIRKDFKKNTLIVSNPQKDLLQKEMIIKNINWLSGKSFSGKCRVKIRSMAKMVPAKIIEHVTYNMKQKKYKVIFDKEQRAVTPGQSAVFYKGNELLGGGIIEI